MRSPSLEKRSFLRYKENGLTLKGEAPLIDQKLILQDLEGSVKRLSRKGVEKKLILEVHDLILKKNKLLEQVEALRKKRNETSKVIGELLKKGDSKKAEKEKQEINSLKKEGEKKEETLQSVEKDLEEKLLHIPNFPHDKSPDGKSSEQNKEILRENFDETRFKKEKFLPHWEIMDELGIFDQKRASKITGSMFAVLKGNGARLLRSLLLFGFELFEKDYEEFLVPSFVNSDSLKGTGQLPKFSDEAYHIEKDDLWAIPTGEVPLTNLHRNEILDEKSLPLKYMTATPCFRREAGAAGQETRGLQRLHEFHKLELVKICKEEESEKELESLLQDALKPIRELKLPLRVLDLCTGDLTFSSSRTYDIEVYSPGTKTWLEVSSVGLFTDYQCRRSQIRYKENKKNKLAHSLNGSGLASPRVLAAILENYQEGKGKVRVPPPLKKYMNQDYL